MNKIILLLLISLQGLAQSYTVKGILTDTSNTPMEMATVYLLNQADSTMVTFGRTNEKGAFEFKGVKKSNLIFQATYVGYLPLQISVPYDPSVTTKDLGTIKLTSINKELYEVVIKTAKAPMTFSGDTISYDASKFKVPPGSTVEDLLKRLPGFQVDADGNIKAQGESVTKVLVDGKRFFGGDPKAATKNLPSEAISTVKVFNDVSEQAKLTGVNDGSREKTVDLKLKDDYKKGAFGKMTAGVGSEERVIGKGNYNRFNEKSQFSVVGFGNNINQSGLSNNDYQDFKGSQSYNWGDNVDFGIGGDNMNMVIYSDSDNDSRMGIPTSWGPDRGLSKNFAAGLNYNYDTPKNKISSNYFYNNTSQTLNQDSYRTIFLNDTDYQTASQNTHKNKLGNHRGSIRYEHKIDSLRTLIAFANTRLGTQDNSSNSQKQFYNRTNEKFRNQDTYSNLNGTSNNLETSIIFKNEFKNKRRSLLWSGSFLFNDNESNDPQLSIAEEYAVLGESFPIGNLSNVNINQLNLGRTKATTLKTSMLYVEPLSKKITLQTFINFANSTQTIDRDIYSPPIQSPNNRNDSLSIYFDNSTTYSRIGSSIQYNGKGIFAMIGATGQNIRLESNVLGDQNGNLKHTYGKNYPYLLPTATIRYSFSSNTVLSVSANQRQTPPSVTQLRPYIDNSNPMYITTGNPNLKPSRSKNANLYFSTYSPATFMSLWSSVNYSTFNNRIVYNKQIDEQLITYTKPQNIENGGNSLNAYAGLSFPIKKNKLTTQLNISNTLSNTPVYINEILNENNSNYLSLGLRLNATPNEWLSWFLSAGISKNNIKYSIFTDQNQVFRGKNASSSLNIQFPKKIFFTTDFNYSHQRNERINLDQHFPILGMNLYKIFGKKDQHELRLSVNDLLNRNIGISNGSYDNEVYYSNTVTLSRYLMLSYSFNIRGMKTKIKRNAWE